MALKHNEIDVDVQFKFYTATFKRELDFYLKFL